MTEFETNLGEALIELTRMYESEYGATAIPRPVWLADALNSFEQYRLNNEARHE